jgi:hypothetical protein
MLAWMMNGSSCVTATPDAEEKTERAGPLGRYLLAPKLGDRLNQSGRRIVEELDYDERPKAAAGSESTQGRLIKAASPLPVPNPPSAAARPGAPPRPTPSRLGVGVAPPWRALLSGRCQPRHTRGTADALLGFASGPGSRVRAGVRRSCPQHAMARAPFNERVNATPGPVIPDEQQMLRCLAASRKAEGPMSARQVAGHARWANGLPTDHAPALASIAVQVRVALGRLKDKGTVVRIISALDACWALAGESNLGRCPIWDNGI